MIIKDIMSTPVECVASTMAVVDAIQMMARNQQSCVLVGEGQKIEGIITERDVLKSLAFKLGIRGDEQHNIDFRDAQLKDLMTTKVVSVQEDMDLFDALVVTKSQRVRHLPVVNHESFVVGLVTQFNIISAYFKLVDHQAQLEKSNQALKVIALEDSLLGVGNRRAMEVDLAFTQATSLRQNLPYSIALFDVDFFKLYNDSYGHQAGDDALIAIADVIRKSARAADRIYRYGGEEILVVMQGEELDNAILAAERIRHAVEDQSLEHQHSPNKCITISGGVATGNGVEWKSIVAAADRALYQAKRAGRNCIVGEKSQ